MLRSGCAAGARAVVEALEPRQLMSAKTAPAPSGAAVHVDVDWSAVTAHASPLVYGSNDYDGVFMARDGTTDPLYTAQLRTIGFPLMRVLNDASNLWTDAATRSWNPQ